VLTSCVQRLADLGTCIILPYLALLQIRAGMLLEHEIGRKVLRVDLNHARGRDRTEQVVLALIASKATSISRIQ
jgi:hypothetical protein